MPMVSRGYVLRGRPLARVPPSTSLDRRRACPQRSSVACKGLGDRFTEFFSESKQDLKPPRPNERFTLEDIKRIKEKGPTMEDIEASVDVQKMPLTDGTVPTEHFDFISSSSFGTIPHDFSREPHWHKLPQMPANVFLHGLRERNWTSPYYNPNASKWTLQLWQDHGRYFSFGFHGYRVLLTEADGTVSWVDMSQEGAQTYVKDTAAANTDGGVWKCAPAPSCPCLTPRLSVLSLPRLVSCPCLTSPPVLLPLPLPLCLPASLPLSSPCLWRCPRPAPVLTARTHARRAAHTDSLTSRAGETARSLL